MSDEHEHEHGEDHEPGHHHDHGHDHEHDHDHDHDHALIVDRLPAGDWAVDPDGSEVLFKARILGVLPMVGAFEEFQGALAIDPAGAASGKLAVQTASVNSGWGRRDAWLRGDAYLQAERFPEMVFTLDGIEPSGAEHQNLMGSLQIHDRSVPLAFPVYAIAHDDHLHLEGEVRVDHELLGLTAARPFFVGSRLRLEAALTLTRA
jgi:polyisoprenoid-binding protein YceI